MLKKILLVAAIVVGVVSPSYLNPARASASDHEAEIVANFDFFQSTMYSGGGWIAFWNSDNARPPFLWNWDTRDGRLINLPRGWELAPDTQPSTYRKMSLDGRWVAIQPIAGDAAPQGGFLNTETDEVVFTEGEATGLSADGSRGFTTLGTVDIATGSIVSPVQPGQSYETDLGVIVEGRDDSTDPGFRTFLLDGQEIARVPGASGDVSTVVFNRSATALFVGDPGSTPLNLTGGQQIGSPHTKFTDYSLQDGTRAPVWMAPEAAAAISIPTDRAGLQRHNLADGVTTTHGLPDIFTIFAIRGVSDDGRFALVLGRFPYGVDHIVVDLGPVPGQTRFVDASTIDEIVAAADYNPNEHAQILRLYQAIFDRRPDVAGAKYWLDVADSGSNVLEIAGFMALSPEWETTYAGVDDAEFLDRVYRNMLDRDPDPGGFQYWLDLVSSGQLQRSEAVYWVTVGSEFSERYPFQP